MERPSEARRLTDLVTFPLKIHLQLCIFQGNVAKRTGQAVSFDREPKPES